MKSESLLLQGHYLFFTTTGLQQLQKYLQQLDHTFSTQAGGAEARSVLEKGLVSFFQNHCIQGDLITLRDVRAAISWQSGSKKKNSRSGSVLTSPSPVGHHSQTPLARARNGRWVAGVARGIAWYWGIPVWLVRTVFLLSCALGGLGLILYLTLVLSTPEADWETELRLRKIPPTLPGIQTELNNTYFSSSSSYPLLKKNTFTTLPVFWVKKTVQLGGLLIVLGSATGLAGTVGVGLFLHQAKDWHLIMNLEQLSLFGQGADAFGPLVADFLNQTLPLTTPTITFSLVLIGIIPFFFLSIWGVSLLRLKNSFSWVISLSLMLGWLSAWSYLCWLISERILSFISG